MSFDKDEEVVPKEEGESLPLCPSGVSIADAGSRFAPCVLLEEVDMLESSDEEVVVVRNDGTKRSRVPSEVISKYWGEEFRGDFFLREFSFPETDVPPPFLIVGDSEQDSDVPVEPSPSKKAKYVRSSSANAEGELGS